MASKLKRVNVPFTDDEMERLSEQAASRGLSTTSFCRLVVTGAMLRGGGTLDQILMVAEAVNKVPIKAKPGRDYRKLWVGTIDGIRYYKSDPEWVMRLPDHRDPSHSRGIDKGDPRNWWILTHPVKAIEPIPLEFNFKDAAREATRQIEGLAS